MKELLGFFLIGIPMSILVTGLLFLVFYFPFAGHQLTVVAKRSFVRMTHLLWDTMSEMLGAEGIDPSLRPQFVHEWGQLGIGTCHLSKVEELTQKQLDFYSRWLQLTPFSTGQMKITAEIDRFVTWYNSWKDFMYNGRLMPYIRPLYFWYNWPADGKHLVFPSQ